MCVQSVLGVIISLGQIQAYIYTYGCVNIIDIDERIKRCMGILKDREGERGEGRERG